MKIFLFGLKVQRSPAAGMFTKRFQVILPNSVLKINLRKIKVRNIFISAYDTSQDMALQYLRKLLRLYIPIYYIIPISSHLFVRYYVLVPLKTEISKMFIFFLKPFHHKIQFLILLFVYVIYRNIFY